MLRSMNAAITGLRNHQIFMDVIGNNIANVNTTGFKASRVTFQTLLHETLRGALAPAQGRGGINALQVGMGVAIGSIDPIQTQGVIETTGSATDLAIQGRGYFVLTDGFRRFFSRDGSFDVGADSSLVDPATGLRVQGWQANTATGEINTAQPPTTLTIPVGLQVTARPTTALEFVGNLAGQKSEQVGTGVVESDTNDGTVGFVFKAGESLTFTYDGQAFITDTSGTAGGTLTSGVIESKSTADAVDFAIATTDSITFSYDGRSFTTAGLAAATAGTTTLAAVAADLQTKMRAAVDAVLTPLGFAANTDIEVRVNNNGVATAGLANDAIEFVTTNSGLAFAANASSNAGLHTAIQNRSTDSVPVNVTVATLATDVMKRINAKVPLTAVVESPTLEKALAFAVSGNETISFTYGGVSYTSGALQQQDANTLAQTTNSQTGIDRFADDLQTKLRAAGGAATTDIVVRAINQTNSVGEARLSITGGSQLAFGRDPVSGASDTVLNSVLANRATILVEANDDLGNIPGEAALRITAPRPLQFGNTASDNVTMNSAFQNREALGLQAMQTSLTEFDSLGNPHELQIRFTKSVVQPDPKQSLWNWDIVGVDPGARVRSGGRGTIIFDSTGTYLTTSTVGVVGPTAQIEVEYTNGAATPQTVRFDLSTLTSLSDSNTVQPGEQDGFSTGTLVNFVVGQDGVVTGNFSNGQAEDIAQIAIASFANPAGLEQLSDNLLVDSANSGLAQIGPAQAGNRGSVNAGHLEASNVDLAQEFTNMIRAERGFQANSRVITTSDELLQDLVNLKR
ncbi:MAG: hypothetical protein CL878_05185 [Dehalococcoidia bacterium]|nr:hypothetical protein [Dehalococcoidia bacterium]